VSLHVPQQWGPYGKRHLFPEPYLAYPVGSPVKEPSLQVPFGEICPVPRALLHSCPSPQYMSPLPGSPAGPLWREMPISRAFLYTSSRVRSKGAPPLLLQVPLTELPQIETLYF